MQSKCQTVLVSEMIFRDAGSDLPQWETEVIVCTMAKREHSSQTMVETKPSSEEMAEREHSSYVMTERKRSSHTMANGSVTIRMAKIGDCCYCD